MVNYWGDAARLFDDTYEYEMAQILSKGDFVTNISNYDYRIFQKHLIQDPVIQPEVAILGSSRTMLINESMFPGQSVFNHSVTGASMEDLIALYQIYREEGKQPDKIILGIDPWAFNENNQQNRWVSIGSFYDKFLGHEEPSSPMNTDFLELVSFSYFQNSMKNLPSILKGTSRPRATQQKENNSNTLLKDGSLVYAAAYREATNEQIEAKVRTFIEQGIFGLNDFDSVSVKYWNEFELLLTDIKKQGVEVEFFLAPYHPAVYSVIEQEYPNVLKVEQEVRAYADEMNIRLRGSFNPGKLGMDSSYFYDGMHSKEHTIQQILSGVPSI